MEITYEVVDGVIVKKYDNGDEEKLGLLEDVDILVSRAKETLDRVEKKLTNPIKENKNSALSIMFESYVREYNELKRISCLKK